MTKVRRGIHWPSLLGVALLVTFTLGAAASNLIAPHIPTARERQRAEQEASIAERRARIGVLLVEGDRCRAPIARELARALVFDGRSAMVYAESYARRCGDDPVVKKWGEASKQLPHGENAR